MHFTNIVVESVDIVTFGNLQHFQVQRPVTRVTCARKVLCLVAVAVNKRLWSRHPTNLNYKLRSPFVVGCETTHNLKYEEVDLTVKWQWDLVVLDPHYTQWVLVTRVVLFPSHSEWKLTFCVRKHCFAGFVCFLSRKTLCPCSVNPKPVSTNQPTLHVQSCRSKNVTISTKILDSTTMLVKCTYWTKDDRCSLAAAPRGKG